MKSFYGRYPDGKEIPPPTDTTALRDHFAGLAMQGLCSSFQFTASAVRANPGVEPDRIIATSAYELADAMLKAREAKP